jgi:hypothetical protein
MRVGTGGVQLRQRLVLRFCGVQYHFSNQGGYWVGDSGAPGEIRTPDLQLRRLPLYPAELRARDLSVHWRFRAINVRTLNGQRK